MLAPQTDRVNEPRGVSGWLALLCLLLLAYHPLSFAVTAAAWLGAIWIRGAPLAVLLAARLGVTGAGVAAGIVLLGGKPGAVGLAQTALGLSAAMDVFVYVTSYAPNNRVPGDTPFYVAGTLIYHVGWIAYLSRSKRVLNTIR